MPKYKVIVSHLESQEWSIVASNEKEARDNWGIGDFEGASSISHEIVSVEESDA
tara:strand:+ start:5707 stop:5868 length:162 start_codon:yes stop_codon:yes gene_type:complete